MASSMKSVRKRPEKKPSSLSDSSQHAMTTSSWSTSQSSNYHRCDSHPYLDDNNDERAPPPQPPFLATLFADETMRQIAQAIGEALSGVLGYLKDLLLGTLLILRPLLSLILAGIVLLVVLGAVTRSLNVFRSELQTRVLCQLPLMGYLVSCDHSPSAPIIPPFAELVDKQATTYEYMYNSLNSHVPSKSTVYGDPAAAAQKPLGARTRGSSTVPLQVPVKDDHGGGVTVRTPGMTLPMQLKKAEMAVVDLKVLIRHSGLPDQTKGLLVERLESFHKRARVAGRKLQVLQTRANGCIDSLVIRNTFLIRELDRLSDKQQKLADLNTKRSFVWKLLFGPLEDTAIQTSNVQLQSIYQGTMGEARDQVRDIILKAQDVLEDLEGLEALLMTIHDLSSKEQADQRKGREEVLASLWTLLGFSRMEMRYYNENLQLLQDLDAQRRRTVGQVQATLWKLTEFEIELGLLREKMVDVVLDPTVGGALPTNSDPKRIPGPASTTSQSPSSASSQKSGGDNEEGFEQGTGTVPSGVGQSEREGSAPVVGSLSPESVAKVLRSHIDQIDQVSSRLRERSLVSSSIDASMEWIATE